MLHVERRYVDGDKREPVTMAEAVERIGRYYSNPEEVIRSSKPDNPQTPWAVRTPYALFYFEEVSDVSMQQR